MPNSMLALERVLLALWVGALWAIGYLAAPVLFSTLDDRMLAGRLAGEMFHWLNYVGMVIGTLLLISNRIRCEVGIDRRAVTLILMLVIILLNQYGISPMMAEMKAGGLQEGSANAAQFARLHGIASVFYLINSLLGVGLVVFGIHKPEYLHK
jgi:hypothetical protein